MRRTFSGAERMAECDRRHSPSVSDRAARRVHPVAEPAEGPVRRSAAAAHRLPREAHRRPDGPPFLHVAPDRGDRLRAHRGGRCLAARGREAHVRRAAAAASTGPSPPSSDPATPATSARPAGSSSAGCWRSSESRSWPPSPARLSDSSSISCSRRARAWAPRATAITSSSAAGTRPPATSSRS